MRHQLIAEHGFDPKTHAILSYAGLDMQVVWKVLAGLNEPFIAPIGRDDFRMGKIPFTCLQPVVIYWLARRMMTCEQYRLMDVYWKLFGLAYHQIRNMTGKCRAWLVHTSVSRVRSGKGGLGGTKTELLSGLGLRYPSPEKESAYVRTALPIIYPPRLPSLMPHPLASSPPIEPSASPQGSHKTRD
jgi:hypothetical protein